MQGLLVRIGIDQAYGQWNAPVDPDTMECVYVPIPEKDGTVFQPGMERTYQNVMPALENFAERHGFDLRQDLKMPHDLPQRPLHLDPDFDKLTYGDNGLRRGKGIHGLGNGDVLLFYGGLRPIRPCGQNLIYALIGLYVIQEVVLLKNIPESRWDENAHTRKGMHGLDDVIVRAIPEISGRLKRCIPIGEWRNRAYRVREDILGAWGGISVQDGYIQRSMVPPAFLDTDRLYSWFQQLNPILLQSNFA